MPYSSRPPRYPTHIPIVVTGAGGPQSGVIVDINAYGACLEGITDVEKDDQVVLRGAVESSLATVRWHEDDRAGVYFERPVEPQHLAMLRLRGVGQSMMPEMERLRAM